MGKWLAKRLREASTWRGIVGVLTAFGLVLSPEKIDAIVAAGLGLIGVIGAFFPDSFGDG